MPVYRTLAEWETHAAHLRKQILSSAGLFPLPEKTPLHPRIFDRLNRGDYSIEKVLLETWPGFYLGGNLYRPLGKTGRFPGVASPHGHAEYGRLENTETFSIPGRCINLARQGYVVFAYDMVGYGDTIQVPHEWGGPHGLGGLREELWSFNTMGLQLWDSIRAIDFLQSLPDVDPDRMAVTGASGGGTQTFLLSAIDPRVKVAAPVNMISAILQGGTCQSAPGLREDTFNVEIGALMAPRPLLMISATGDWTHNTPVEEFPATQSIYRLYGKPELVESVQINAPHNYNRNSREAMYRFFGKFVLGDADAAKFSEKPFKVEKLGDLLALMGRNQPDNALHFDQLLDEWITNARRRNAALAPAVLREHLAYVLGADWPSHVLSEAQGERIVLSREGKGDRIPGIQIEGKGGAVLIVHPDGSDAARNSPEARKFLEGGRSVLMIDAYQTGKAVAPRKQIDPLTAAAVRGGGEAQPQYLVFNKSDAANRVQDILTALAYLKSAGAPSITLVGVGEAAVWTVFAAAVAKAPVTLVADVSGFGGDDRDFTDRFFVPGIQNAGGLQTAVRLARLAARE
jgi:dienelactone hydrolase